jgi:hypothetical protein
VQAVSSRFAAFAVSITKPEPTQGKSFKIELLSSAT